jgi:hypothetical protein
VKSKSVVRDTGDRGYLHGRSTPVTAYLSTGVDLQHLPVRPTGAFEIDHRPKTSRPSLQDRNFIWSAFGQGMPRAMGRTSPASGMLEGKA